MKRERADHRRALHVWHERVRPDHAVVRVDAPDERLDRDDVAARQREHGLEVNGELPPTDDRLELAHDACVEPLASSRRRLGIIGLRYVHVAVGMDEQGLGRLPVARVERPADRSVDLDGRVVDAVRPLEGTAQPPGEDLRLAVAPGAGREHDELVATETGDRVARAHDRAQAAGDRPQHCVAGVVAAHVVDGLEPVEVDREHGERLPVAVRLLEHAVDPVFEQQPVREPRERVSQRERLGAMRAAAQS